MSYRDLLQADLHKKFPIPVTSDQLTGQGCAAVIKWLLEYYDINIETRVMREDIGVVWVEIKPQCYGRLPNRIGQYVKKCYHKNINEEKLGNMLQRYRTNLKKGFYDFDKDIDWQGGDFGDGESCFMAARDDPGGSIDRLRKYGFFALRLWSKDLKGMGRCWIGADDNEGRNNLVMFNPYGGRLVDMAEIVRQHVKAPEIHHVRLEILGDTSLYVNEGDTGFVVVNTPIRLSEYAYTVRWKPSECSECHTSYNGKEGWNIIRGKMLAYCPDCAKLYTTCKHCGRYTKITNNRMVGNDEYVCQQCFEQFYAVCVLCGHINTYRVKAIVNGVSVNICDDCQKKMPYNCDRCNASSDEPMETVTGQGQWCSVCIAVKALHRCATCGKYHTVDFCAKDFPLKVGDKVRLLAPNGTFTPHNWSYAVILGIETEVGTITYVADTGEYAGVQFNDHKFSVASNELQVVNEELIHA